MRFYVSIAFALLALSCSEPRLELHLVRSASSPLKREAVEPTPCQQCVAESWVAHDGTAIDLKMESDPFLSIPAHRLSDPEIVHGKSLYRPFCDWFTLSFRLGVSLAEMIQVAERYAGQPAVAMVKGHAIDAGRHLFSGETLTLAFADKQGAVDAAQLLGASPTFREEDDPSREGARQQQRAALDQLFDNPEELRRLAAAYGVRPEDLDRDEVAAQLLCP